jgi:hypothetical protein
MAVQNQEARNTASGAAPDSLGSALAKTVTTSSNITVDPLGSALTAATADVKGAVKNITGGVDALGSALDSALSASIGDPLGSALKSALGGFASSVLGGAGSMPKKNILSKYASYNCVFTFGPLTHSEVNHPDATYRKNGPSTIVLRSGGTGNKQVPTQAEQSLGITGEYYIDDVEVTTLVSPNPKTKQTNATSITFKVTEPYSMGMFLQTLMVASLKAGHKNYIDAPFLLQLEFIGWDDEGRPLNIPKSKRMFPLKLTNTTFNVTTEGSVYEVSAIPWHEQAFTDQTQGVKTDIDIKGSTLIELLQTGPESLATILNNRELEQVKAGNKKVGDQHIILFPTGRNSESDALAGQQENNNGATTQSSKPDDISQEREISGEKKDALYEALTGIQNGNMPADFDAELSKILGIVVRRSKIGESIREFAEKEENVNKIGKAKIVKSYLDSGKAYFGKPAFVKGEKDGEFKRGNITVSDEGRRIQFKQGTRVQNIIEELILLSDYGRGFATEVPDDKGFKSWFKIEANVYNIADSSNVAQTGETAKVYVYKVVPYKVHVSRISSPTQAAPGIKTLKQQAMRTYDYIYTGKNDDVLNFDIHFDAAFFTSIQGDFGQLGKDSKVQGADKKVDPLEQAISGASEGDNQTAPGATAKTKQSNSSTTGKNGSGTQVHPETQVARSFNDAIVNSPVDMIRAEIEIWGDPYYIADSGMGNYDAPELGFNMTADGTMDYQNGEVDVLVNFRTPIDYGRDGNMAFPSLGTKPLGQFSGLYQVISVANRFSKNNFTQVLNTIRRRNQEIPESADIVEAVVEKGVDAVISPIASAPAASFAKAQDALNSALSKVGDISSLSLGDALGDALNNVAPDLGSTFADANTALNTAKDKLTSAASGASDALSAALKGK